MLCLAEPRSTERDRLDTACRYPGAWRDEPWESDAVAEVGEFVHAFYAMILTKLPRKRRPPTA